MTLTGKGMMIWQIPNCEGGNVNTIANMAAAGGFSHILIKIADGPLVYNKNKTTGEDLIPPLVSALRAKGIGVWGWHYVYGYNPTGEAAIAITQMKKYQMDGYVIDAEAEFEQSGRTAVATTFMSALRAGLPSTPVALCSFRWPTYHPSFPWKAFLDKCDLNMPQVYWMSAHNPATQLTRSLTEFKAISPFRPLTPTGPAFYESSWSPTPAEVVQFLDAAKSLGMSAANFFSWDDSRKNLPAVWTAISNYSWAYTPTTPPTPKDITQQYIDALNTKNLDTIVALFNSQCVHIDAQSTIQGTTALRAYFSNLLNNVLPGATFTLANASGTGSTRNFTWTATSSAGKVLDGSDTFGLVNDLIAYHYTFFNITS
ncbi:MAG: nuclear transport factor 2 family protein [Anaerolineaceae bacterium]